MKLSLPLLLSTLFLLSLGCKDDSDGGITGTEFPRLKSDPTELLFPVGQLGQGSSRTIRLSNEGGSRLRITQIDLSNTLDSREFVLEHSNLPIILEGGEGTSLALAYTPRNAGTDHGNLIINSNDPNNPAEIPINSVEANTELRWRPERLVYMSEDSSPITETLILDNLGSVPVRLLEVYLAEETDGEFKLEPLPAPLPTLDNRDSTQVQVTYTPEGFDRDEGTLILVTDDPLNPHIYVPLIGNQPTGQLLPSPSSINFGALNPDTESEIIELVLENVGNASLHIQELQFSAAPPGVNEQFLLHDLPDSFPISIAPDEIYTLGVQYRPTEQARHETGLAIRTSDPLKPVTVVPVQGRVKTRCITFAPERLDFGAIALTESSAHKQLGIVNCGDLPVTLSSIQLEGDPNFHWTPAAGEPEEEVLIPGLSTYLLELWYENLDLQQSISADALLKIENNTPEQPLLEVPLSAFGGGAPTCNLLVIPSQMNFGLVSRGQTRTRSFEVINAGTGRCEIRAQRVDSFNLFGPPSFILTQPIADLMVLPGASSTLEITFRAQSFFAEQGHLVIDYWDPFLDQMKVAEARMSGLGGESHIEVIPGRLDFGAVTAGECASQEEHVTVYNTGIVDLCITEILFEGDCNEFILIDYPVADEDGCINVTRNNPAPIVLVYEPGNLGVDECELVLVSSDQDNPRMLVPILGEGVRERSQTDIFVQTSGQTVDVLFMVDNSGSMSEEQDNLDENFAEFIRGADTFSNDYQLGIITSDMDNEEQKGRLQGNPRVMANNPDIENQFANTVHVGTEGAGEEHGLEAAHHALSDPLAFDSGLACTANADCAEPDLCVEGFCGGFNRGFLREEAALEIIFVSDEDDFSPATLNFYVDFFKNLKGFRNEGRFHAHAIVGARGGHSASCEGPGGQADAGQRYVEVAHRSNGQVYSICDDDFGRPLQELGNQAFGLPRQFFLSRPAERASVEVLIGGQPAEGWSYDQESNSVIFEEEFIPQPGEQIEVSYEAQCFPRRL